MTTHSVTPPAVPSHSQVNIQNNVFVVTYSLLNKQRSKPEQSKQLTTPTSLKFDRGLLLLPPNHPIHPPQIWKLWDGILEP